ncbi:OLC1v1031225C1 [Oldenlandia corymbosa var. corymbosa]|uniref:OLC1v1031225C1 n=1 Tax=Oldenlandia corymbosa var. corymbosa TaxID=529605 RepID=A0AAV1CKY0_OLDCO|nr:OLC1v1031225C1 [Oldenlandia corymbosa var. corymbosa]
MADENVYPENQALSDPEPESMRLKTLAEQTYAAGNLKSALKFATQAHHLYPSLEGIEELLMAFEILCTAIVPISLTPIDETNPSAPAQPDYYKILQVERFAHINTIKKQYRKLALALHPDKHPFVACEEAFKYVAEGFGVLSDRIKRKEYDMKLRVAMQNEAEAAASGGIEVEEMHTFWTSCSTCRLLHKFERKYLGHILVCPSCKKSFEAVEAAEEDAGTDRLRAEKEAVGVNVRSSERIRTRSVKMSSVGEILERSTRNNVQVKGGSKSDSENFGKKRGLGIGDSDGGSGVNEGPKVKSVGLTLKNVAKERKEGHSGDDQVEVLSSKRGREEERLGGVQVVKGTRAGTKRLKVLEEEMMTLAEMQLLAKKKCSEAKLKGEKQGNNKKDLEKDSEERKEMEKEKQQDEEEQVNGEDIEKENMEEEGDDGIGKETEVLEETGKDAEKECPEISKKNRIPREKKVVATYRRERKRVANDETMALAEMQLLAKKKCSEAKLKGEKQGNNKKDLEKGSEERKEMEKEKQEDEEEQVNREDKGKEDMEEEEDDGTDKETEMHEEEQTKNNGEKEYREKSKRNRNTRERKVVATGRRERKRVADDETMALAEMQLLAKKKFSKAKLKGKKLGNNKKDLEKDSEEGKEMEKEREQDEEQVNGEDRENENVEEEEEDETDKEMEMQEEEGMGKNGEKECPEISKKNRNTRERNVVITDWRERSVADDDTMGMLPKKTSRISGLRSRHRTLQNPDFHEFDKERAGRSFKTGQVWAIYDSEDGMPRHYGLIDEVVSVDPFEVKLSWLEYQSNGDHQLLSLEKMGFYASCGRFKVSEKVTVKSLKMFSHLADSERAAREVYRIYPKKGSVWAIYNNHALLSERNNQTMTDKHYDIVLFLTNYSDIHGSSMAFLERVEGFKAVFKRREIGPRAIKFLERDNFKLLSHQIPARKLSGEDVPGLPKCCWELDPASLPQDSPNICQKGPIAS